VSEHQTADVGAGGAVVPPPVIGRLARAHAWIVTGPLRYVVPPLWIAVAVAATLYLPSVSAGPGALGDLTPRDAAAIRAEREAARLFAIPVLSRTVVVQRDPGGLTLDAQKQTIAAALAVDQGTVTPPRGLLGALPIINAPGMARVGRVPATTAITLLFFDPATSWGTRDASAAEYARAYLDAPGSSVVGVTGAVPARLAQGREIVNRLELVEIATVIVIAVIVGLTFRAVGAPLITLAAGIIAYLVAIRVAAWVGGAVGVSAPAELQPLMVVLLLGIVTDYSIFYLSGFRNRLVAGVPRNSAVRWTTAEFTPVIVTAGLMVAAGALALLVARLGFMRALGPGMALAVVIGLVVAVTLVPALLAVFGRLVFWPRVPIAPEDAGGASPGTQARSLSRRVAHLSTNRAVAAVIILFCVVVLVAASTGLMRLRVGFNLISVLPSSAEVKQAADAAEKGFSKGILSPTEVIIKQPGVGRETSKLRALERAITRLPGVAQVIGPREQSLLAESRVALPPIAVSRDRSAARYLVVFDVDPLGSEGIARYDGLRAAMPSLLSAAGVGGASVLYAGDTALAEESVSLTMADLIRVALAVLIVDFLLLVLFLRALLAPLYLAAASMLALTAALGVTSYVFVVLLDAGSLTYYVPLAAAVLLVSLGSDYNVFLVGRIWEEARVRPWRPAIEDAVPRVRRAISVAALALASSFALLAIVGLSSFRELAFLLCFGVLVDAFFVRSLLVPALVVAFGRAGAWPGRLGRGTPRLPEAGRPLGSHREDPSVIE